MTYEQAREELKGFAIVSMGQIGNKYYIKIGNCGRDCDQICKFSAGNLEMIVANIKKKFA